MKNFILPILGLCLMQACNNDKSDATIKKSGDAAVSTTQATQTINGQIKVSDDLKTKGLKFGKYTIEKGSGSDNFNVLHVYVVFDQDAKEDVNVRVYDNKENEYGRITKRVKGKSGDAKWIDFEFDTRTDLENGSKFEIE